MIRIRSEKLFEKRKAKMLLELEKTQNARPIIMHFKVKTCLDERLCSTCSKFEGLKMDVLDAIISVNHPPFHDDCRCFAIYSVEGIEKK